MKKMLLSISIFFVVVFLSISVFAASYQDWVVRYGTSYGGAQAVLVDSNDGIYVVGSYASSLLVLKYDSSGNQIWQKLIPSKQLNDSWGLATRCAVLDPSNNLVLVGLNGFITKIDPDGNIVWDTTVAGVVPGASKFYVVKVDSTGNIYAAGYTYGVTDQDALVVKYSSDGQLLWVRTYDGEGDDIINTVKLDSDGNIYLAGISSGSRWNNRDYYTGHMAVWSYDADGNERLKIFSPENTAYSEIYDEDLELDNFGNINVVYRTDGGFHVNKYDPSGNLIWIATQPFFSIPTVLRVNSSGDIYIAGISSTATGGFWKYLLLKYDLSGRLLWKREYSTWGDSEIYNMILDCHGDIYVTGEFGYSPSTIRTTKINPNGGVIWSFDYTPDPSKTGSYNYGLSIDMDSKGNVYVAGRTYFITPTLIKYVQDYVQCDKTPPTTTATVSGTIGNDNWYISDVQLTLTAVDNAGGSGVKKTEYSFDGSTWNTYLAPFTINNEGATTVYYKSTDNVGNVETAKSISVKIDKISPTTSAVISGTSGNNGWYISDVTIEFIATDTVSGVKAINYSINGGTTTALRNRTAITLTADGRYIITYYAVDNAGNIEAQKSMSINIDRTAPPITAAINPTPNANGWNNTDVAVSFICSDSTSGIASCPSPITVTTEGAGQTVTGTAVDNAGNSASVSVTLNIDKTAPTIATVTATPNILWPPNHKMVDVMIDGSAIDNMPGIASVVITVTDEYGIYNMTVPGFGSTIQLEAWREGTDKDGRTYTITVVATDNAGNQSTATTNATVPHDMRK